MLSVHDLTVAYGKAQVVHGASLAVPAGQIVALLGPNGAGKTTILNTISGILRGRSGRITLDNADITRAPPHAVVRAGLAHCPEGRQIFPALTVQENLLLGAYSRRAPTELDYVLALFPRLKERLRQSGGTLSGGEQQMLAIGRALMAAPRLLMLDEPSLGLAPVIVDQVFAAIAALPARNLSVLLVEQNAARAFSVCHRAYVLTRGVIAAHGSAEELLASGAIDRSYLGSAHPA